MIIPHDFNIELIEYADRDIDNDFPVFDCCPKCGCHAHGNVYRNGFYHRNAKTKDMDEYYRIPIRRMRCKSCKGSFSVLPDFLIPYFQNTVDAVLGIVEEALNEADRHSPRQTKWYYKNRFMAGAKWVYHYLNNVVGRFNYPNTDGEAALVCLKRIFKIGCRNFFLASWNHLDSYLMAR
jgi:hypothetical protein